MKFITLFLTLLIFVSCGSRNESEEETFQISQASLSRLVNAKVMPSNIDLSTEKTLLNRDYPIEVVLFSDGTWFYDLPNLGEGRGTYTLDNGVVKLFAERVLFDINIEIVAKDEAGKDYVLKFSDRFGPKSLDTEKINF